MLTNKLKKKIEKYLNKKELEVFGKILKRKELEDYFLSTKTELKWFFPLKIAGYFSPEKAPGPQPSGQEGYFTIPQWNVLQYLERVSLQVKIKGNEQYINELLEIITIVSNYKDVSGRHIANYRTWWHFVKILLNIPNDKIPLEIIELIPIWLDSKFDTILTGSGIVTKLLPKFLPDSPTIDDSQKAEKIVDYVTEIKWLKLPESLRTGFFGKEEDPKTIIDSYWLTESFINKKNAVKVGEKCSVKSIYLIADKLKEIWRHQHPWHWADFELNNKNYRVFIQSTKDFGFNGILEIVTNETNREVNNGTEILKPKSEKTEFVITEVKNITLFIDGIKSEISKLGIARDVNQNFEEKIRDLYKEMFSDHSYMWFESISEGPGIPAYKTEASLVYILRDIFLAKAKKDKQAGENIIEQFLGDKYQYPLFRRLVLFVIAECWNDYKKFWDSFLDQSGEEMFENPNYENEIYTLLKKNISNFTPVEKGKLEKIIEKGPTTYLPQDKRDKYISYWKQKWYSSVKADSYFSPLYNEQKQMSGIEKERVGFGHVEVRAGPGPSPLAKVELLGMPNDKIAEFLLTFETKNIWEGPTVGGLSDILQKTVQEKPEKFIDNLGSFLKVGYLYIYDIIWGINNGWKDKKSIDWGKLFDFIKQYINQEEFWQDKFKIKDDGINADYKWAIGAIGELIQEGTKDDNWAFDENYLPAAQDIIYHIIDKLQKGDELEIDDPIFYVLNSPFGKIITALIYLALRIARIEAKKGDKKEVKWSHDLKSKYEKLFNDGIIEAYILFGRYMPNLYYLDKQWVEQKIVEFDNLKNEQFWAPFMIGYIFSSGVYDDLYKLMKKNYLKALSYSFKERTLNTEERLIQHIAIGYLRGLEDFSENSIFGLLLKNWNYSQIKEIIGFFWMQRKEYEQIPPKAVVMESKNGEVKPKIIDNTKESEPPIKENERVQIENKIIEFWRWTYDKYKSKPDITDEDKKILSNLARLTTFLPQINSENFKWLELSAPYVLLDFSFPFFIEYLDKLKDKGDKIESAKYVAKIFLKMLKVSTPDFDQKHIKSIVEYLFKINKKETKEDANTICNEYSSRNYEFLKEIWVKYNTNIK
jgi:hypothetical protein